MNEEINQLEQYIFAKNRRVFLDNLIKDTESHYYFSLLDAIDNQGNSLTHEQEQDLKRYRNFRTASSKGIRVRYLFRKYDLAETEEAKKKIIQELNSKLFKVTGVLPTQRKEFEGAQLFQPQVQQQQQQYQIQQISSNSRQFEDQRILRRARSQSCSDDDSSYHDDEDDHGQNIEASSDQSQSPKQIKMASSVSSLDEEERGRRLFGEIGIPSEQQQNQDFEMDEENEEQRRVGIEEGQAQENESEEDHDDEKNSKKYKNTLDTKREEINEYISKQPLNNLLNHLYSDSLIRIPLSKITHEKDIHQIEDYLAHVDLYSLSINELKTILLHLQSLQNKSRNNEQEINWQFHKLTLEQMQSIPTYLPDVTKNRSYIQYLFLKSYDLSSIKQLTNSSRIDSLKTIYEWSKTLKQKFQSLQDQILFEILYQGIQFDIYDMDLFMSYIQNPKEILSELNENQQKKFRQQKKQYDSFWHSVHNFESTNYSQVKLVKKYIKRHLRESKTNSISPYDEYFSDTFLQKTLIKCRLYAGDQNVPKVSKFLTPNEINTIYTSKELKILKTNKKIFKSEEKVTLHVQLKNIDTLYVKIFNFQPENYYLKNLSPFNEHVDLDGLNPNEEVFFDFKEKNIHPCTRFIKSFDFESIQQATKGIFIIEFFSSGIASRAIIYKGSLSQFSRDTIAGQEIVILDEEGQIQTEDRVGLWIEKQFYKANKDGRIIIPYRKDFVKTVQAVLVSGNYAELCSFIQQAETYSFSCNYIYNQESFVFGNKVQIIIQPSLTVNSEIADVSLLKNTEITIVTVTTEDVPQTTRISKKALSNSQDILVEFILPAKTKSVKIEVNTKLDTMTQSEEQKLSSSHLIPINQHTGELQFASFFLQNVDQYYILVLGKNGEPLPDFKIRLTIHHKYYQDYPNNSIKLQTNEEGRIALGKLDNVVYIYAQSEEVNKALGQVKQKWTIERDQIRGIKSLPRTFQIKEGSDVEIPLLCREDSVVDRNQYTLIKMVELQHSSEENLLSCLDQINCISYELSKVSITSRNTILISGLAAGLYLFRSKLNTANFIIKVYQNCRVWQHSNSVESATSSIIIKDRLLLNQASIGVENQIRVEKVKYESSKCTIQLNKQPNFTNTRVHVIGFQFFPNGLSNPYNQFSSSYNNYKTKLIKLSHHVNKYMSNRQLGDEFAYVLDRKVQTRFTGNSLEKPSLALKRNFIQTTTTETENLGQGKQLELCEPKQRAISRSDFDDSYCEDYNQECEIFERDASYCMERERKPIRMMATKAARKSNPCSFNFDEYDYICETTPINAHLNFLKNPCMVIANLIPNTDGLIEFDADLRRFSAIQIITKTPTQHNVSVHDLNLLSNRDVEVRDLRQKTNLQKGKYYSIFRNTQKIMKGQQCSIDDITSTEISIIDSLNKAFDFQIELSRFQGTFTDNSSGKGYTEEWEFLKKWESLTHSEKSSKYNTHLSHELNFFIYMKDQPFFDSMVKGHLQNKLELTLVDMFLLEQYHDLINKYYHVELLDRINPFELSLILFSLVATKDTARTTSLWEYIKNQCKQNLTDKELQKKYFEIILNKQQDKATISNSKALYAKSNLSYQQSQQNQMYSNFNNNNNNDDDDNCSVSFEGSECEDENEDDDCSDSSGSNVDKLDPFSNDEDDYNVDLGVEQCEEEEERGYDLFGGKQKLGGKGGMKKKKIKSNSKTYQFKPITQQYKQQRQLYSQSTQSLKKTDQYCERHYLNQRDDYFYGRDIITFNNFWLELAQNIVEQASLSLFLSTSFLECNRSHSEMVLVLSLLQLPFNSPSHNQYSTQGKDQVIIAADNLLLYTKEIKETSSELKSSLMINQRFFDPNDKYEIQGDEKFEKDVEQFIINYIYGCQVIVTNCTGGQQQIQVLTDIPEGSIPVHKIEYTKSYTQLLDSYSTKIIEFYFYFPQEGQFSIYPANVSKNGQVLCSAKQCIFNVQRQLTEIKLNTLGQVLTKGTKEDILTFLREKDWQDKNNQSDFRSTFQSIVSMCTDKEFYLKLITIMREKHYFNYDIWKYSLLHLDHSSLVEFINCSAIRNKICKYISHLNCSLMKQSFNVGEWNKIYEYYPLINSRVHLLKRDSANILNIQFRRTYCHFLKYVVEKGLKNMSGVDRLVFVYYLLLQDRVETAIEQFEKIYEQDITSSKGSIQYDYIKAYLDFYKGYPNFKVAREVIEKYLDYPITSWRNLFYEMANQLAEYDGEDMIDEDLKNLKISGDSSNKKDDKVSTEKQQVLSIRFDEKKIIIEHKNVPSELTLTYYKIDLEVFFSKKPFLSNISEDFSYLQPTFSQKVILNEEDEKQTAPSISKFDMPEHLQSTNVYIQAISGPFLKAGVTYFSTQLKVSLYSDEAQLKITDQNNILLSKIYVKVFSKNKSGKIDFIKDGYTDLRGKFDYLLSSTVNINDIDRLSLFIMSDDLGSLILEAKPPKQVGKFNETVELRSKNWNLKYQNQIMNKKKSK